MKVKVISRSSGEYMRETKNDLHKVHRNYDPSLHPFAMNREYQRALNAVKLDRVFAKPFIGSLDGHSDSVQTLKSHPSKLGVVFSGAFNGEIKVWNLSNHHCLRTIKAHNGICQAITIPKHGEYFFSADNNQIKQWDMSFLQDHIFEMDSDLQASLQAIDETPMNTIVTKNLVYSMDHHGSQPYILSCGQGVQLWEENRTQPLRSWEWGVDSVSHIKFNPIEHDLAVGAASDRSVILYDIRKAEPVRKVVLAMRTNAISWNPMEASTFTCANEDYQLHTFDMRRMAFPLQVHKDHVSAVISLDYSPTGREFVSAGYDKTIRIWNSRDRRSKEVYHTKRMQRLTDVLWSNDSRFIISSSDEFDIRIWKANPSEKLGFNAPREEANFRYQEKIKTKFGHHPEIKRIAKKRYVPKAVLAAQRELDTIVDSQKRKETNRAMASKPGTVHKRKFEVQKQIVREEQ